jgi:hypothetical protein
MILQVPVYKGVRKELTDRAFGRMIEMVESRAIQQR